MHDEEGVQWQWVQEPPLVIARSIAALGCTLSFHLRSLPPPLMQGDPLGGCNVTPAGYFDMTRRLAALSPASRIVLALEGGYNTRCAVCAHTLGEEVVCPGA